MLLYCRCWKFSIWLEGVACSIACWWISDSEYWLPMKYFGSDLISVAPLSVQTVRKPFSFGNRSSCVLPDLWYVDFGLNRLSLSRLLKRHFSFIPRFLTRLICRMTSGHLSSPTWIFQWRTLLKLPWHVFCPSVRLSSSAVWKLSPLLVKWWREWCLSVPQLRRSI